MIRMNLSNRLEKPFFADGARLAEVESVPLILLHVRDDEWRIRRPEPLSGGFVALLGEPREAALFGRVTDERQFLYVLEVLVERGGRRRAEITLGPGLGRLLHTRPLPMPEGIQARGRRSTPRPHVSAGRPG